MVETALQMTARHSSPTLRSFETNPFRILRLTANATTSEASFQAERVLTLMRAGIAPTEDDLLPWLPPASIYEIQQASQTIEEPLARLTEQLLWFDTARDPAVAALQAVLGELKGMALRKYLEQEEWLPKLDQCPPADDASIPVVAQAINHANLRLLVAASMINGAAVAQSGDVTEPRKIAANQWQKLDGLVTLAEAHNIIAGTAAGLDAGLDARHYWVGALRRWAAILSHPWFRHYLIQCITDLGDDFVTPDDAETIEESIRTRLADLSAKETRFLLLEGRYPLAGGMISAVAQSGLERRVLSPALRPLHHLFQAELSELQALLGGAGQDGVTHIDAYLKRLEVIKGRWQKIDEAGIVGLNHMLDDALEQAYLRLRTLDKLPPQGDELLTKIGKLAAAGSLRERINFFRRELEEAKSRLCYFCKTGTPDYEKSVVLTGKKETGRQRNYNSTTIYYSLRYTPVLRCARCARFHDFLSKFGRLMTWSLVPPVIYLLILFGTPVLIAGLAGCWWIGLIFIAYIPKAIAFTFRATADGISAMLARKLTPADHRRYGETDYTAERTLLADGYGIVATDWRSDAVSRVKGV